MIKKSKVLEYIEIAFLILGILVFIIGFLICNIFIIQIGATLGLSAFFLWKNHQYIYFWEW